MRQARRTRRSFIPDSTASLVHSSPSSLPAATGSSATTQRRRAYRSRRPAPCSSPGRRRSSTSSRSWPRRLRRMATTPARSSTRLRCTRRCLSSAPVRSGASPSRGSRSSARGQRHSPTPSRRRHAAARCSLRPLSPAFASATSTRPSRRRRARCRLAGSSTLRASAATPSTAASASIASPSCPVVANSSCSTS